MVPAIAAPKWHSLVATAYARDAQSWRDLTRVPHEWQVVALWIRSAQSLNGMFQAAMAEEENPEGA